MRLFYPKLTMLQGCIIATAFSIFYNYILDNLMLEFLMLEFFDYNYFNKWVHFHVFLGKYLEYGAALIIGYYIKSRYIHGYMHKRNILIMNSVKQKAIKILDMLLSVFINSILPYLCMHIIWFFLIVITFPND